MKIDHKKFSIALAILAILFLVGIAGVFLIKSRMTGTNIIVGDDKDAHVCIGSAGYSWCEAKQKCARIWEEPECQTQVPENDFLKVGNLVMQKNSDGVDQWAIVYEEPGEPALRKFLVFAENCSSNFSADERSCDTDDFVQGARVEITAKLIGDSEVVVSKIFGLPD